MISRVKPPINMGINNAKIHFHLNLIFQPLRNSLLTSPFGPLSLLRINAAIKGPKTAKFPKICIGPGAITPKKTKTLGIQNTHEITNERIKKVMRFLFS